MFIVPAEKDTRQISRGRGKGSLVTLWNKSITKYVSKVSCSSCKLQASKFSFPKATILITNCYFRCNPRVENFDDNEILNTLAKIVSSARRSHCPNIVLAADLNYHFSKNTRFTKIVKNCLSGELGLNTIFFQLCNNVQSYSKRSNEKMQAK